MIYIFFFFPKLFVLWPENIDINTEFGVHEMEQKTELKKNTQERPTKGSE